MSISSYLSLLILVTSIAQAGTVDSELQSLQKEWAHVEYELKESAKKSAFMTLLKHADHALRTYPNNAEVYIWHGIVNSTFAKFHGGISSLENVGKAKEDFEHALELDPKALGGAAYTQLGTLYYSQPGWPISFGNYSKAEELLLRALEINPNGIDANFFYGDFLISDDRDDESIEYFLKALKEPKRVKRNIAYQGRIAEIKEKLFRLRPERDE